MSYYGQGDFYGGGGYYRGDPGFLGSLARGVVGGVGGFLTGGWAGAAIGAVQGFRSGTASTPSGAGAASAGPGQMPVLSSAEHAGYVLGGVARRTIGVVSAHPVLTGAGAVAAATGAEMLLRHPGGVAVAGAKGYHMSKPRRGRCPSEPHLVRNRRMNVFNPRALRRAARRAHGFLRMSRRLVHYYTPHAHKGKAYIRVKKRAK